MAGEMNYYEVLEVPTDAPQTEIHKAYQRAKSTYSQDNPALYSMFTRDEARDLLKMIEEAYAVLGNHALRKSYDDRLKSTTLAAPRSVSTPFVAPVHPPVVEHSSLPDFIVPDPAIPNSTEPERPASAAATPGRRPVDPLQTSMGGPSESLLVTSDDFTVRKRDSVAPPPRGMGRCPLGTYKIDDTLEKEIEEHQDFDGPFLQKVRVYRQVPLERLSESSRIGKTYLIALEANDFRNLPAPVFLRGFLVQIARQLGLNEGKVVTSYMKLAKASGKYGS